MVTWLPSEPPFPPTTGEGPVDPGPPSVGNGPVDPGPPIVGTGPVLPGPGVPPIPVPARLVVGATPNGFWAGSPKSAPPAAEPGPNPPGAAPIPGRVMDPPGCLVGSPAGPPAPRAGAAGADPLPWLPKPLRAPLPSNRGSSPNASSSP